MRLVQFGDLVLPAVQHVATLPRKADVRYFKPIGVLQGEYDLYGSESPLPNQSYKAEFIFTDNGQYSIDFLMGMVGQRLDLIQLVLDGTYRQTKAKLVNVEQKTTVADKWLRIQRISAEWVAEPLWYAWGYNSLTEVNFSGATNISVTNAGNANVIKGLQIHLTFSSVFGASRRISADGGARYLQYSRLAGGSIVLDVDCGAGTVSDNNTGLAAYANTTRPDTQIELFMLKPGTNAITFDLATTGYFRFRSAWK